MDSNILGNIVALMSKLLHRIAQTMISTRLFSTTTALMRISKAPLRKLPQPSQKIQDPKAFLTAIGRKCDEFADVYENNWNNLFEWDSRILKEKGVPPQQRKYILMQVEKLRKGEDIREFKQGKKSFFGGERKRKETIAKWRAEQRSA